MYLKYPLKIPNNPQEFYLISKIQFLNKGHENILAWKSIDSHSLRFALNAYIYMLLMAHKTTKRDYVFWSIKSYQAKAYFHNAQLHLGIIDKTTKAEEKAILAQQESR